MDTLDARRLLLKQSGFTVSRIVGVSMRPLIWAGQHCVAVIPLEGEPEIGDLLVFMTMLPGVKEQDVVHRLIEIRDEGGERVYVTRGDNNLMSERVRRSDIIGRVAEVHRITGWRPWHAIPARKFAVTDRAYRCYTRLWMATWPLRRLYYRFRARLYALRRR